MKRSFFLSIFILCFLSFFSACPVSDLTDVAGIWKCRTDRNNLYYILAISPKNSFTLIRYEKKVEVDRKSGSIALLNGRLVMEFPVEGSLKVFTLERRPLALVLKDVENPKVDMEFYPTKELGKENPALVIEEGGDQ